MVTVDLTDKYTLSLLRPRGKTLFVLDDDEIEVTFRDISPEGKGKSLNISFITRLLPYQVDLQYKLSAKTSGMIQD